MYPREQGLGSGVARLEAGHSLVLPTGVDYT